jgi:hypothetical protein
MDADKGLLGQVFGLGVILGHAQQVIVDRPLVFGKDIAKACWLVCLSLPLL